MRDDRIVALAALVAAIVASGYLLLAATQGAVVVGDATHGDQSGVVTERVEHRSLLQTQGAGVLAILAIPVALCAVALLARRRGVTTVAAGALTVFSVLGAASIGLFFIPAAVLLLVAAASPASAPAPE